MINLNMRPDHTPLSWEQFCLSRPPFSAAIDGYVNAPPVVDLSGPFINMDHHVGVNRHATRATCAQALMKIRMGLFRTFSCDGEPTMEVWANDCDEDVCLTWFLLQNGNRFAKDLNPRLDQLVNVVDLLDTTAGMYPLPPDTGLAAERAWVFEPYNQSRQAGELAHKNASLFRTVVDTVHERIEAYIQGKAGQSQSDNRYKVIGGGPGWTMAREIGAGAKMALVSDGITAFVLVREANIGHWTYVVGRISELDPFPLPGVLKHLNNLEQNPADHWGGGTNIGGSPRTVGSRLSPTEVQDGINEYLAFRM